MLAAGVINLEFSFASAVALLLAGLLCWRAGWRPWHWHCWLVSRPLWLDAMERIQAGRLAVIALEATVFLLFLAVALAPVGVVVAWSAIFFRAKNKLPPLYGVLVLLGGVGLMLASWAVMLWRSVGYSPRALAPKLAAAASACFLFAFLSGAAFSGGGTGVFRYTTDGLFFAIMSLAFGLSIFPLVPLSLIAGSSPNGGLAAFAERAFAALSAGRAAPPRGANSSGYTSSSPGCQGVLARRTQAVPLFVLAQLISLGGALAFALLAKDHRGAGFVAAGAVIVADTVGALAWNSGLVLHRAPGTYLVAAGLARGSVILFPVRQWFLGHSLLFALVASALASAAAARRWPVRDAAVRRREELADTLEALRELTPHGAADAAAGAQGKQHGVTHFGLSPDEVAKKASWLVTTRTGLWLFLSVAFGADLGVVVRRQPPSVPGVNSRHPQWQYGVAALLAAPAAAAAVAFVRAWAALPKDLEHSTLKPRAAAPAAGDAAATAKGGCSPCAPVLKAVDSACAPAKAAVNEQVDQAVGWFWSGELTEESKAVMRHIAAAGATIAGCAVALAFAANSNVVLALGVFGPVLISSAQALARDAGAARPHAFDPRQWSQQQRRAVLWVFLSLASLAAVGLIIGLDPFRKRMAKANIIRPKTPYARPGYHALAVSLGCAFAEASAAAFVRLYQNLEIRALGAPLSLALLVTPLTWLGCSLGFVRSYRRGSGVFAQTQNWDLGVALVTSIGAPGLLAFFAGLLMWRDAANWAPVPPASILALLGGGIAACGAASALVAALLFPVLGAGLIAATLLALAACLYVHVWAKNARTPPRHWHWMVIVAGALGVAVGMVSGFRSADGFRGFSVAWLSCCAIAAAAAARPLASAPRVLLSPALVPAYRWDNASSRVNHSTWCVLTLAGCAAAVFAWAAVAAPALNPPSGGAAAAIGTLVLSLIAAASFLHADRSAASAALDKISNEGLALAAAQAGRAVGLGLTADPNAGGEGAGAGSSAPLSHEQVAVAVPGEAQEALPDPLIKAEDAAAAKFKAMGLVCRFAVPMPPPESDNEGARMARSNACRAALLAQAAAAEERLRFFRFSATLAALVRRTAEAEQAAEDAALRAFLVSLGHQAAADVRWTAQERERISAARAEYVESKRKEREENERREREAEEARRRRAAAAAAAAKRRREQSLGLVTCEEVAGELRQRTQGKGPGSFSDDTFPAGLRALYVNGSAPQKGHDAIHESVRSWKRASELVSSGQGKLFAPGTPDEQAERVKQGAIGDCWAISAISVLASQGLAEQLFMTPYNHEGAYCVRFFRDGVWEPIVIDDSLPMSYSLPAFAKSGDKTELWVPLLEKAYAKFYQAYEELEGGWISDALEDFTGGDGSMLNLSSAEAKEAIANGQLWERLRAAFGAAEASAGTNLKDKAARVLMGCGSQSGKDTDQNDMGIVLGHAYSILSVHEVDGHKLLKLRNPWGSGTEWKGAWSDKSPEWTPRTKKLVNYNPAEGDGVFFMEFSDWLVNYRTIYFCHIYPSEQVLRANHSWPGDMTTGKTVWNGLSWARNKAWLIKREDGAARPTAVYITLSQSEYDHPDKKVTTGDGGAAAAELAAGVAGGHVRALGHMNSLVGMRFDIFRETGEPFDVSNTVGINRVNDRCVHEGRWSFYQRKTAIEVTLPAHEQGWVIVPTCSDLADAADYSIAIFSAEKLTLTERKLMP